MRVPGVEVGGREPGTKLSIERGGQTKPKLEPTWQPHNE